MHQIDGDAADPHRCKSSAWPALAPIRTVIKKSDVSDEQSSGHGCFQSTAIHDSNGSMRGSLSRQKNLSCGSPFSLDASVRRRFSRAISYESSLGGTVDCHSRAIICADDDGGCSDTCSQYSTCHENSQDTALYKGLHRNPTDAKTAVHNAYGRNRCIYLDFFLDSFICRRTRNALKTLALCFCYTPRSSTRQNQNSINCTSFPANYTMFPAWNNTPTRLSGAMSLHCNMYNINGATATTPNGTPSTPTQHGVLQSPQRIHQRVGMSPRPRSPGSVSWQSHLIHSPRAQLSARSASAKARSISMPALRLGENPQNRGHEQLNEPTSPKVTCIGKVHRDSGCKKQKDVDRHEPHRRINKDMNSEVKLKKTGIQSSRNPLVASTGTLDRAGSHRYETDASSTSYMNVCPQRFSRAKPHNLHKICDFINYSQEDAARRPGANVRNLHATRLSSSQHGYDDQKPAYKSVINKLEAI